MWQMYLIKNALRGVFMRYVWILLLFNQFGNPFLSTIIVCYANQVYTVGEVAQIHFVSTRALLQLKRGD